MKLRALVAALFVIAISVSVASDQPAKAYTLPAQCASWTGSYYFNAVQSGAPSATEIVGRIEATSPTLCVNGATGSGSWIALEAPSFTSAQSPFNIVQVGYWRCVGYWYPDFPCDGQLRLFWAWGDAATATPPQPRDLGVVAAGSSHSFAVRLIPNRSVDVLYDGHTVGSVALARVPWIAPAAMPVAAEEAWDPWSFLGGTVGNPQSFTSTTVVPLGGVRRPYFDADWAGYTEAYTANRLRITTAYGIDFWTVR